MFIRHLSLTGFRNYGRLELDLLPGTTILHGENAQGKTNLLEAVYYLATTRSPYSDSDQQIINWDINIPEEPIVVARLVATIQYESSLSPNAENDSGSNQKTIELRLIRENRNGASSFRREAVIDRRKVRLMDLLGQLKVVLFLPSDLELITGGPSARRRYMDITLCQTDAVYCRSLSGYNKLLEQRNAALKNLAETGRGKDVVNILSERLADVAAGIFARRAKFMHHLAEEVSRTHYEELTSGIETAKLSYLPRLSVKGAGKGSNDNSAELIKMADWILENAEDGNLIAKRYLELLQLSFEKDLASGVTAIGPHRDDWRIWVNGRHLGQFGSRGQQRTAMLALKIAEIRRMVDETNETPILLLDEVASELDEHRRQLLLTQVTRSGQALLTTTSLDFLPDRFHSQCTTVHVVNGHISPAPNSVSRN